MIDKHAHFRVCLLGMQNEIKHLLDVGIKSIDWYLIASECFILLNDIPSEDRTLVEVSLRKDLFDLIDNYEEKHFPYGN